MAGIHGLTVSIPKNMTKGMFGGEYIQQAPPWETGGLPPLRERQWGAQNRYSCSGKVLCALRELWVHLVWVEPKRRYGKLEQIE